MIPERIILVAVEDLATAGLVAAEAAQMKNVVSRTFRRKRRRCVLAI
jgi:hypothetical protein